MTEQKPAETPELTDEQKAAATQAQLEQDARDAAERATAEQAAKDAAAAEAAAKPRRGSKAEKIAPKQYTGPAIGSITERDYFAVLNADGTHGEISEEPPAGYGVQIALKGTVVTPAIAIALGKPITSGPVA